MHEQRSDQSQINFLDNLNENQFEQIVSTYRQGLIQYLFKHTRDYHIAEDLCQESLIRAYSALSTLESSTRIKSWLYSIAYHVTVDWLRTRSAQKRCHIPLMQRTCEESETMGIDSILIEREEKEQQKSRVNHLWSLVKELPPIYRKVFELRYRKNRPIAQISKQVGVAEGNIKVRLFRARRMILHKISLF